LFHPNSKFADGLRTFEDKYPVVYATLKKVAKDPDIQNYLKNALKPFAVKMFGKVKPSSPEVQDMGKFVKHLTPANASAVQNIVSRAGAVTKETPSKPEDPTKNLVKSVLKHGFSAVKALAGNKTVQNTVITAATGAIPLLMGLL